jgi:lambda family phage portal protein
MMFDFFKRSAGKMESEPEADEPEFSRMRAVSRQDSDDISRTRYGNPKYRVHSRAGLHMDYAQIRAQAREIYGESTIAQGIVKRFVDTIVNTGLTFESKPQWDLIPNAPEDPEERYNISKKIEQMFDLFAAGFDADITRQNTFYNLQRLEEQLYQVEGETFFIIRYLSDPSRISPVALQMIDPDQVVNPYGFQAESVTKRGGKIRDGIEFDREGVAIAIYVTDGIGAEPVRVPFFSPYGTRRFVIHRANRETAGQVRGMSEIQSVAYELNRLTEYEIAEMEAVLNSSLIMATVEAQAGVAPGKGPKLNRAGPVIKRSSKGPEPGTHETVRMGSKALMINNIYPGYTMKPWSPTRPNQNYEQFVIAHESRVTARFGMPHSVFRMMFDSSYTAARAEAHFFFYNVDVRRSDSAGGFLNLVFEAWFTEAVRRGDISAPGFTQSEIIKRAWLSGSWNGIVRLSVDPAKELGAVEKALDRNLTTGQREAKIHNGSDFRENVRRRAEEKKLESESNPTIPIEQTEADPETETGTDQQNGENE